MAKRVYLEFTKEWGMIEKGTTKRFPLWRAKMMQDQYKVGKIVDADKPKAGRPKAVKPDAIKPEIPENVK